MPQQHSTQSIASRYVMKISRLTVDKLGVKLYDRVSAVLAELVANSYDADATEVVINAPMGEYLAIRREGQLLDQGYKISVEDDGVGMTPDEVNDFYLRVGAERRNDPRRGDLSPRFKRRVMGRKGVGKLAPFGICDRIELVSSGGELITGYNERGEPIEGYLTAHLILDRTMILSEVDEDYEPEPGPFDGQLLSKSGTTLILTSFERREVPTIDELARQLAHRFGVESADWRIRLLDAQQTEQEKTVGDFNVDVLENTRYTFTGSQVIGPNGNVEGSIASGFEYEGRSYTITGWIAYSKYPFRDDLMAGVRIYCRGKISAQTAVFGRKAGFTGEYDVRSYLVGQINADWLDEDEDLIQTDRRDILWSHGLGRVFEEWGQSIVIRIARAAKEPIRKSNWTKFSELTRIDQRIHDAFPAGDQMAIRKNTHEIAELMAKHARSEEIDDADMRESIVQMSILFGPHLTVDESMKDAASPQSTFAAITQLLQDARVAEYSSFGRIAYDRVRIIEVLEQHRDAQESSEAVYQELLENAPWLIDPRWSPIMANRSFSTLRSELERYLSEQLGEEVYLQAFGMPLKRVDFILHNHDQRLELIEIKPPRHVFGNEDMARLNRYHRLMNEFLDNPGNQQFRIAYPEFHITLVCDEFRLGEMESSAYEGLVQRSILEPVTWGVFLSRTKQMHSEYLSEADRQRSLSTRSFDERN